MMKTCFKYRQSAKMEKSTEIRNVAFLLCFTCVLLTGSTGQTTDDANITSSTSTPGNTMVTSPSTTDAMMNTTYDIQMNSSEPTTSPQTSTQQTIATNGTTTGQMTNDTTGGSTSLPPTNSSTTLAPTTMPTTTLPTTTTTSTTTTTPTAAITTPTPTLKPSTTTTQTTMTTTKQTQTMTTTKQTQTMKKTTTETKGATDKVVDTETSFGRIGLPLFIITFAALLCVVLGIVIFYFHGKRRSGSHYLEENGGPGGNVRGGPMTLQMEGMDYGTKFETIDLEDERKSATDNDNNTGLLSFKHNPAETETGSKDDVNSITVEPPSWLRVEPTSNDDTASNFSTQAQTDDKDPEQEEEEPSDNNEPANDNLEGSDLDSVNSSAADEKEFPLPPPPEVSDDPGEEKTEM
ncbi:uncharacterized protein LOC132562425 [Ylistrum balloti]|uniref:uncharacterized protein LOC132562425 n=1 Tax=Ylistrum balloti TaxID=509963 RepID=UPI002905EF28|nr:uncharacterized protein LOC132562425 [Ylistrum balloti]